MTAVIDEKGNLFGYVNVIDAFAVMLVAALVIGGVALVHQPAPPEPPEPSPQTMAFTAEVSPVVASAMMERQPTGDAVLATGDVAVADTETVWQDGRTHKIVTVSFSATLPVINDDGTVRYQGQRLLIGKVYELDLGYTMVDATLVDLEASA